MACIEFSLENTLVCCKRDERDLCNHLMQYNVYAISAKDLLVKRFFSWLWLSLLSFSITSFLTFA